MERCVNQQSTGQQIYSRLTEGWHLQETQQSHGEGSGNPLQNSCLENPMDRGAWGATVHGVAKRRTWHSDSHAHTHTHTHTAVTSSERNCQQIKGIIHLVLNFFGRKGWHWLSKTSSVLIIIPIRPHQNPKRQYAFLRLKFEAQEVKLLPKATQQVSNEFELWSFPL